MTQEEFEALVGRLEPESRSHPTRYRRRVIALALAGYAYLAVVLALLLALFALALFSVAYLKGAGVKLAFVIGAFLWFVVSALWVRLLPPEGIKVTAREAPELLAVVERLRKALDAPPFHEVVIDGNYNASVVQVPRLGIFGWYRNYLTIGLPLMKVLTPAQMEAVIAHELGHLAGGHGRMSNWIYRLRLGWGRLLHALETSQSRGTFLFKPFFTRYEPYFHAYSFPLARANEYEADAAAARLTSTRSMATALATVEVMGAYMEKRFWPSVQEQIAEQPRPSFRPAADLDKRLAAGVAAEEEKEWLESALKRPTTVADTHPSLSDRLAAINEPAAIERPAPGQGADRLLGGSLDGIVQRLDEQWVAAVGPAWEQQHEKLRHDRERLTELQASKAGGTALDADQMIDLALLTEGIGEGEAAALPLFRDARDAAPDNASANFHLGVRLLKSDDDGGIALVERAMQIDISATVAACEILRDYAWRKGRAEDARNWDRKLADAAKAEEAVWRERTHILPKDKFDRHGLDPAVIERLRKELAGIGVLKAWIARKRLQHNADHPIYVLGIISTSFWKWARKAHTEAVEQAVYEKVRLPQTTIVVTLVGDHAHFRSKFRWKRARVL